MEFLCVDLFWGGPVLNFLGGFLSKSHGFLIRAKKNHLTKCNEGLHTVRGPLLLVIKWTQNPYKRAHEQLELFHPPKVELCHLLVADWTSQWAFLGVISPYLEGFKLLTTGFWAHLIVPTQSFISLP